MVCWFSNDIFTDSTHAISKKLSKCPYDVILGFLKSLMYHVPHL